MPNTAIGDGDSSGYEVILMISFVICHDKLDGDGGQTGTWVSEKKKEE